MTMRLATQTALGMFSLAVWASGQIFHIEMLLRCLSLARREGYKAFKLERWTVEEHVGGNRLNAGLVWFRDTIEITSQHQMETAPLEPVFKVDDLVSHMDITGIPLPR